MTEQDSATGLVQIYTGNGKGKTTAALGLAVRARAVGKRVAMIFFDKGGQHYSERLLLEQLGILWFAYGLDRIDAETNLFRFGVIPEDIQKAEEGMERVHELLQETSPSYDLVILDEVNTAVALGMLTEDAVDSCIDRKARATELVLTGRIEVAKASRPLRCDGSCMSRAARAHEHRPLYFDRADLLTEMTLQRHYFYKGTPARAGIDY